MRKTSNYLYGKRIRRHPIFLLTEPPKRRPHTTEYCEIANSHNAMMSIAQCQLQLNLKMWRPALQNSHSKQNPKASSLPLPMRFPNIPIPLRTNPRTTCHVGRLVVHIVGTRFSLYINPTSNPCSNCPPKRPFPCCRSKECPYRTQMDTLATLAAA